jgi:transposase
MTEPLDPAALADLPATARALITTLQEQLRVVQRENAALRQQLEVLCQRMFGKRSERVDPRQLQLALEQLANERGPIREPIEMDSGETPVRGHARRRPTGRRPLPAHLPRHRVEIDLPETEKPCACGHTKTRIGESVSEKLEYQPASFVIIETVRAKYACPQCHDGVVEAPAPPQSRGEIARGRRAARACGRHEICRSHAAPPTLGHVRARRRRPAA